MSGGIANADAQAEVPDIRKLVEELDTDLECAESCETHTDLVTNLEEALSSLRLVREAITEALAAAKRAGPEVES